MASTLQWRVTVHTDVRLSLQQDGASYDPPPPLPSQLVPDNVLGYQLTVRVGVPVSSVGVRSHAASVWQGVVSWAIRRGGATTRPCVLFWDGRSFGTCALTVVRQRLLGPVPSCW
jgi:hypothetical protein